MPDPTHVKLHHQFVALIDMYQHATNELIPPIVFEILMFKNPAIWLAKNIFALNLRTRFFPDMRFYQNHKGHYGAWFKPKKSTYQWTTSFVKSKKPYFGGVLGHYRQSEIFSQKSGCASFLPLRQPNFMRSFRKILWGILKTCLPTDIVT